MVYNPKHSQEFMSWCISSALTLIFESFENVNERLTRGNLNEYFNKNTDNFNVTHIQLNQTIYDLKRRKYIEFDEGDSVKLTNKAKIKIIDKVVAVKEPDGKCRLVSFDIPESKSVNRNCFRRAIKRMGFRQVQKSLWVCNRNVGDLVEAAAKEYKVNDYVAYFISDRSNIDKYLSKILGNE